MVYIEGVINVRLTQLLEERERTLYWLSQETGVRYATVWKLSRGEVGRLNLDALDRVCEALDCQPGDLLVRESAKKRSKSKKAR